MLTHSLVYLGNRVPDLKHFTSGAYVLVETTPTDYHQTVCGLEDLGWEVRDCLKVLSSDSSLSHHFALLRKPFKGSVVQNVLTHQTGGLNIDGCRIPYGTGGTIASNPLLRKQRGHSIKQGMDDKSCNIKIKGEETQFSPSEKGRFPANLIIHQAEDILSQFPEGSFNVPTTYKSDTTNGVVFGSTTIGKHPEGHHRTAFGDTGSAARFFRQFSSRSELNDYLLTLIRPAEHLEVDS